MGVFLMCIIKVKMHNKKNVSREHLVRTTGNKNGGDKANINQLRRVLPSSWLLRKHAKTRLVEQRARGGGQKKGHKDFHPGENPHWPDFYYRFAQTSTEIFKMSF